MEIGEIGLRVWGSGCDIGALVAELVHFTLFGIILPNIKLKVYTFFGLMNSASKRLGVNVHC